MSADLTSGLLPITEQEGLLLRLFRCMTGDEQLGALAVTLRTLAMRLCVDPASHPFDPNALEFELDMDLDERLRRACPFSWPGQNIVELDNTGDPGYWLEVVLDDATGWFCAISSDRENATEIAQEYLSTVREQGYPLPSDFSDAPNGPEDWTDEDDDLVQTEFRAFLSYWRQMVLRTIAAQSSPGA